MCFFKLDNILIVDRLMKEIAYLEKSLQYRRRIGDPMAKSGLKFILETKRRDNQETLKGNVDKNCWTFSEKMKLLLKWARLVCAHYAIQVIK
jgi:hypothetical protein